MPKHIRNTTRGQGLVEYALVIVGIALAAILIMRVTGVRVSDIYCQAAGALGAEGACAQTGCSLAFDDASTLDDWNAWDAKIGNLTVEDGKLCNTGNQMNYFAACAEGGFDGAGYSDFTATLDGIQINNYNNGLHPGFDFTFRSDGQGNAYWLTYSGKANSILFWKQVNGTRILMGSEPVPSSWVNEELTLKLTVEGNTFSAYRNDTLIISVSDDAYDAGFFGWRNKPGSSTCINGMIIQ